MRGIAGLIVLVFCSFLPGMVGGLFKPGDWYLQLVKPSFTPPGWIFGPVWTALYASMGVAAWLVWRAAGFRGAAAGLAVFGVQLVLNGLWSWLFFGLHRPDLALADIGLLWLAIAATILLFWRHSPTAGAILVPYLCWVSFAAALNGAIWKLNS